MIKKLGEWFVRYLYTCVAVFAVVLLLIWWFRFSMQLDYDECFSLGVIIGIICFEAVHYAYGLDKGK